jgi:hypothetical protein
VCDALAFQFGVKQTVTSKGLCQQERGADVLVLVFVIEDSEEDAIH